MNVGLFDAVVRWSESTGCSMDEALAFMAFVLFIFFALWAWAVSFVFDLGSILYEGAKKLFFFIYRQFRRKEKKL